MLSSEPAFSVSSFTFIKRLFSSSSLSAIRVVSSGYLRLLIFLPEILIPACASFSLAFYMMYSAYKAGSQLTVFTYSFPNLDPVCCSMPNSHCCFLTYIQVSQAVSKVVWYSHFFKDFQQFVFIHRVKGFSIVKETEVDVFLEFSCSGYDPAYAGNLISGSSAFSKTCLNIWKFVVHVLLKPSLKNFEHYFTRV